EPSFAVSVSSFAVNTDGRRLFLGQSDGTLTEHDGSGWGERQRISIGWYPTVMAVHPDNTRLAIAGQFGREIQVRDAATGDLLRKWSAAASVWWLAWHPAGLLLAVGWDESR